ncbi:rhodanese-like domain-containing protein [Microbacterium sp. No. 7]|uniref:rhodanese-like domain-containing protein n=1 Tax=Microbacterium sp. No. 7 TaxID=1714373 RepID=UPI000AEF96CA|nr:rhodanese-like domain-containing protein [Microbacterium sp. No. 7]
MPRLAGPPSRAHRPVRRSLLAPVAAIAIALGLAACAPAGTAASVEVGADTIVVDVRTPEEYAAGHLDGAQLLDLTGGDLAAAVPSLDPEAEYLVYCRSGNRSSQAVALLERAGFTDVTDLGSLERAASATGIEVVTE